MTTGRRGMILAGASALLALAAALLGPRIEAGAETALDKYQLLLQKKRALLRENGLLQQEAAQAATKYPYILFHLREPRLEFRVRGRTLKSYGFRTMAFDERGRRPADPETVWKTIDKPLSVLEIEGSRPELIPPDPETGREAGLLFSDPNQLAAQTGAAPQPVRTDAGVLGVDVPSEYYIRFAMGPDGQEQEVVLNIRTPRTLTFRQKAADRVSEITENAGAIWSRWWGLEDLERKGKPLLELFVTMEDEEMAKNLHYSLLPGERIFVVPPPPPPIALVATQGRDPSTDRPVPAAR